MKFNQNKIKLSVIGLGYVGLPLAVELSKHYSVIGFDKSTKRIQELNNNSDSTLEIKSEQLKQSNMILSDDIQDIKNCNIFIITVPTPIDENKRPDLTPLENASKMIGDILKKNDIVIYESTVFPGATEEFCVPILEKFSKLKFNIDFYCGYSPERINPGDKEHTLTKITKVISGSTGEITNFIEKLYEKIITAGIHKVKTIKIAEAAKVIENIQRDVNIALINELSMVFDKMDIETMEVLRASETKWNFLPFRPGLVGGHCIGVDPYYLTHKSLELGYNPEMILAGRKINEKMSEFIVNKTINEMTKNNIQPQNSTVAVFGLSFKENCPDLRNSKSVELINLLKDKNCNVLVSDPVVKKEEAKSIYDINLIDTNDILKIDTLILTVPHNYFLKLPKDYWKNLFRSKGIIIDVKSALKRDFFVNTSISYWRL